RRNIGDFPDPEPLTKLWTPEHTPAPHFAATPVAVRLCNAEQRYEAAATWREQFGVALRALLIDRQDSTANRKALFILLASEIETARASLIAAALCASAAVLVVYLFPTTFGDQFMLFNLALLAVIGLSAGVLAMRYERDALLSNILCNRPAKVEFSFTLFVVIAQPFVLLAVAIAVTKIPGVLDWGGGLIELLMQTVGRPQP
uniref:hypothetical protein n=1 Tax=Nevskia sp. TaxID=1929292 RepID=UPI0025EA2483